MGKNYPNFLASFPIGTQHIIPIIPTPAFLKNGLIVREKISLEAVHKFAKFLPKIIDFSEKLV